MSATFHKVGTTYRSGFNYRNKTTFAGVTGKTNASFTRQITKNQTGNQSTTGVTVTEPDATNNAGMYEIEIATTGFVSATGDYSLLVFDTSAPEYAWEEHIIVTADGTGEGSIGLASFTATASDGRITDGAVALADATVRIRNSLNSIIAQFTSSATGVWGPIYLDTGTYTIDVQKSGYASSNSLTIVVSGAVATGPLVDVPILAAVSGSGLTASELWAYGRRMVRNANGTQADTEIKQAVNDALDMISQERLWPYYKTHGEVSLAADYSTGTIAITQASANVTLTTGTWPANAASCKIRIAGKVYRIASRTSGAVVVLTTAWAAASLTAASYVIFQDEYTLPSDCMRVGRLLPGSSWNMSPDPVGMDQILEAQQTIVSGQTYPDIWAVHGHGAVSKLILYPYPSEANLLPFWYYRKPTALVSSLTEADWDSQHIQLLRRAIDYQMALRYPDTCVAGNPDETYQRYLLALTRAVPNDKTATRRGAPSNGFGGSSQYVIS